MKFSPNSPCPCGSHLKYKKCCAKFHKGAFPPNALALMKSRYSAYTLGLSDYIIQTTHPENETFTHDYTTWKASITDFCQHTEFLGLTITSFQDGEEIAYVNFIASLSSGPLKEHSKFVKVNGRWLYHSGTVELSEG